MNNLAEKVAVQNTTEDKPSDKAAHPAIKTKALGRGLDSLLPSGPRLISTGSPTAPGVVPEIQAAAARPVAGDAVMTMRA